MSAYPKEVSVEGKVRLIKSLRTGDRKKQAVHSSVYDKQNLQRKVAKHAGKETQSMEESRYRVVKRVYVGASNAALLVLNQEEIMWACTFVRSIRMYPFKIFYQFIE